MRNNPIAWVLGIFISIYIILAFIPPWHNLIYVVSADWDNFSKVVFRFVFDPTAFAWKWIIVVLLGLAALWKAR